MQKENALQLLKLDPDATPEAINTRYKQVTAFLEPNGNTPSTLLNLLGQVNSTMTIAYDALPHTAEQAKKPPEKPHVVAPPSKDLAKAVKDFLFPNSAMQAGEPFSDQWWNVYKRAIIVALAIAALGLYYLPDLNFDWPQPQPTPTPTPEPTPTPMPEPTPTPTPSPWPPVNPDPSLIPQPNPNPIVIDPTQDPTRFLFGLLYDLKSGKDVQSLIKQPESQGVKWMLIQKHDCPAYFFQLPSDAMTVVSRTTGNATVRVKENYFSGQSNVNDYYLISDNGTWKLSSVQNVGPDLPPNPGDPLSFVYDHFALLSHMTFRQAYDNLDSDYKNKLSEEDFRREWGYSWFVPARSVLSSALSIESETPDDQHPTRATVRLIPSYFTTMKLTTWDRQPAELLIDLVNEDGKWLIHDIRRVEAAKTFFR